MRTLDAHTMVTMPLDGLKLIEASAGTGKTYAIANLYLRYVLAGWPVRQLLVVTFTNAATEELRGRLRRRLYDAMLYLDVLASGSAPDAADEYLELLFANCVDDPEQLSASLLRLKLAVRCMDEAAIYTIHGFCQRALTDHAFNSGQSFDLSLLNDDGTLWEQALTDWWRRQVYEARAADARLFVRANGSLEQFLKRQKPLREVGSTTIYPKINASLDDLYAQWQTLLSELEIPAAQWRKRHPEIREVLENSPSLKRAANTGYKNDTLKPTLDRLHDWFVAGEFDRVPDGFGLLSASNLEAQCKKVVLDKGGDPALSDSFFQSCQQISDTKVAVLDEVSVASLIAATDFAAGEVEKQKQRQQVMAFSDQLNRLHAALQGARGTALAHSLRQAFPIAMIDEFQDTDSVQYGIFRQLYPGDESLQTALIMIGDPKQAIYSFRGGDIFTYMQARNDAGTALYTLNTNWRSVPQLIEAVNALFKKRQNAFIYDDAIQFSPVSAASKPHSPLSIGGREAVPLTLWKMPGSDSRDGTWSNEKADTRMHEAVTAEIVKLLQGGSSGDVNLGDRPVRAGDIAVLVREKRQGTNLRETLAGAGIVAVTVSTEKVFQSAEAGGLLRLLHGVVHCQSRAALRESLGSALLAYGYEKIARTLDDEAHWFAWTEGMRELHHLWAQKGFMVMFQRMMQLLDVAVCLAQHADAERRLTNVLHLAELLQQNAAVHPGMDALLMWFARQIEEASEEEAELRLESDENLVRIVTIHASKGLQYPIVFVPYLSRCRPASAKDGALRFHDEDRHPCLDISSAPKEEHLALAEQERLAEDVRLLYVALTRAEAKLFIGWGRVGSQPPTTPRTALAWLMYDEFKGIGKLVGDDFYAPLTALVKSSNRAIELQPLPVLAPDLDVSGDRDNNTPEPAAATFSGTIAMDWRIASFSALTRDVHQVPHGGSVRGTDDIINFPAGSRVGLFMHTILEELDFQDTTEPTLVALHRKHARRYGLDVERHENTVLRWLNNIVGSSLGTLPDSEGPTLSAIDRHHRLDELPFDFSVSRITAEALNRDLSRLASGSGGEPRILPPLSLESFHGLITGIIDLVFEYKGRFYIADYKSNFLGGQLEDYAPEQLETAVLERRYDLQYLLYTLAVHRYLKQRLPGYDYTRHFGGVYYLFLRGMRPEHGSRYGVWFHQPDATLIEQIDEWMHNENA